MIIQVKDLQFPSYFLLHEIDINPVLARQLLATKIEILHDGEDDTVTIKNGIIVLNNPSSITRFLFNVLYYLLYKHVNPGFQRDKLGLGLMYAVNEYVFNDHSQKQDGPSVLVSLDKLPVPYLIIRELIEPLVGTVHKPYVMFMDCKFIDACGIVESADKFKKAHRCPHDSVASHDYPFLIVNRSIRNEAALMAHIIDQTLQMSFGEQKTQKIIKNILLGEDSDIGSNLISVLRILNGDPSFVLDFLQFLDGHATLSIEEENQAAKERVRCIQSDAYLQKYIKISQKYTPHVFRQWSEWSTIVGLIEKQLEPMRGSMWPATENLKEFEDLHHQMVAERAKKKGKKQLNFEELLEVAREMYNHKMVQPGELTENLLKDNRVWKT